MTPTRPLLGRAAVIFDLDGVLTDTAERHYLSWRVVADKLSLPFDRRVNDEMRGLSRPASLAVFLSEEAARFSAEQKQNLTELKNDEYLRLVDQMTPADLFPGTLDLLRGLRSRGARIAVASSSKNAGRVVERLGVGDLLDALVDANTVPCSKPDPQVFLLAARKLDVPPDRCVVIEDAEAGVSAARAGGMRVVGIGPVERVGRADLVVGSMEELNADRVIGLLDESG